MIKNNTIETLYQLIVELKIPVTKKSVGEELEKHPSFPSLLAVSEVLSDWNIPNVSYELTFDELINVEAPFLAYYGDNQFIVVNRLDTKNAVISNHQWKKRQIDVNEFKHSYQGVILAAEKDQFSGEDNYLSKRRKEQIKNFRTPFLISGVVMVFLLAFLGNNFYFFTRFNYVLISLVAVKTIGLIISLLLIDQTIGSNNPIVLKLCGFDQKRNCNAVLTSAAAKINDELSWSEVGFFYFAGSGLALLINSDEYHNTVKVLTLLNLVTLPYTIYSIYYQGFISKQWCVLCCAVQILLWFEFILFFPFLTQGFQLLNIKEMVNIGISMAVPIIIWVFVKPYLIQSNQFPALKDQLRRIKYNSTMFQTMLLAETQYPLPAEENSLIIGNSNAPNIITIVANPFCEPCATVHNALEEWVPKRDNIKLQVIFATLDNDQDASTQVASHLMALHFNNSDILIKDALDDWYSEPNKNYLSWAKNYPLAGRPNKHKSLGIQKEWCEMTGITGTPTIFINGRKLPDIFQPKDIKYFI